MTHPYWPLFDLRLHTTRLELRLGTDEDLLALAELAAGGIHDPAVMPFATPWTRHPSPELERGVLQWHWRARALWTSADWTLDFVVLYDDRVVGSQGMSATDFATRRTVSTGSWLGREFQGRGLGKEMRAAVLALAFVGLGAEIAETDAVEGNEASLGVTAAMGYESNGRKREVVDGQVQDGLKFRLTRERWSARAQGRSEVSWTGLEPCLPLFGVSPTDPTHHP